MKPVTGHNAIVSLVTYYGELAAENAQHVGALEGALRQAVVTPGALEAAAAQVLAGIDAQTARLGDAVWITNAGLAPQVSALRLALDKIRANRQDGPK